MGSSVKNSMTKHGHYNAQTPRQSSPRFPFPFSPKRRKRWFLKPGTRKLAVTKHLRNPLEVPSAFLQA